MKIKLLASDSLGVRSMATFVETDDVKIIIDPSCDLAPNKYGLPPHPKEIEILKQYWKEIEKHIKLADIIIITHYHYDHFNPKHIELFKEKFLFIKHPEKNINQSQKKRAKDFINALNQSKQKPKKIEYADGQTFNFGKTKIIISEALPHGISNKLGYLLEVCISDGKQNLVFSSDVEGPALKEQIDFMLKNKPDFVIIDGPMTGMLGYRYPQTALKESIKNLISLIKAKPNTIIIDHHLLRDVHWRERIKDVFEEAKKNKVKVLTFAEYNGKEINVLENKRKELYKQFPAEKKKLSAFDLLP